MSTELRTCISQMDQAYSKRDVDEYGWCVWRDRLVDAGERIIGEVAKEIELELCETNGDEAAASRRGIKCLGKSYAGEYAPGAVCEYGDIGRILELAHGRLEFDYACSLRDFTPNRDYQAYIIALKIFFVWAGNLAMAYQSPMSL